MGKVINANRRMRFKQWMLLVTKYGQVQNESKVFAEVKCSYMSASEIIYFKKAKQYAVNILYSCTHLITCLGFMLRGFMQFTRIINIILN